MAVRSEGTQEGVRVYRAADAPIFWRAAQW